MGSWLSSVGSLNYTVFLQLRYIFFRCHRYLNYHFLLRGIAMKMIKLILFLPPLFFGEGSHNTVRSEQNG